MIKRCMIALLVLGAATAVSAADEKSKSGAEVPDKEKVVCKTDRTTGSLTRRKRTCHTRAQWDEISSNARKNVDDIVRESYRGEQGSTQSGGAPGGPGGS